MARKTRIQPVVPKKQSEISQNSISTYNNAAKQPTPDVLKKNRGYNRSVKGDDVKQFNIGLRDIDETIVYYFNNVIKPSVIQNGKRVPVPILYGSPERWAAVQKDGFYRDKNGKIQTPLIMFKRDTVEKNRNLGNKLDANSPNNFSIFQKKYSRKNIYDKFSALSNREPVKELYGVIIPDYVDITYSCIVFTEYVEQMNKIVESINFASDAYWGDPERFNFRAMIDSYSTTTEMNQGEDRTVKTNFDIKMMGHIVPDTINASIASMNKFYSKSSISFGMEVAGTEEILEISSKSPADKAPAGRFYDAISGRSEVTVQSSGMTAAERAFLALSAIVDTNNNSFNVNIGNKSITFNNITIATPPANFPALTIQDFTVFINGLMVEPSAITSITQVGSNVVIIFTNEVDLNAIGDVTVAGKFNI
jgi:hypothetical protein